MNICFVCSGNTCRSPLAEGLFKYYIAQAGKSDSFTIHSAGTSKNEGNKASENSILAAKEYGVDISNHRSRHLTREVLADTNLILVMTQYHLRWINLNMPEFKAKSWLLTDYAIAEPWNSSPRDIPDPYGKDIHTYREIAKLINDEIKRIVKSF